MFESRRHDGLATLRDRVYSAVAARERCERELRALQQRADARVQQRALYQEALQIAEAAAQLGRRQVKDTIEKVVTAALQSVFDTDELLFRVEFLVRRNQVEADFFIDSRTRGRSLDAILDEYGGGTVDVVSFALRVALLELLRIPGPIILDEAFKMVSAEYAPRVGAFLRQISEDLGRQIIIVTHNDAIAAMAHKRYRITKVGTQSKVVEEV